MKLIDKLKDILFEEEEEEVEENVVPKKVSVKEQALEEVPVKKVEVRPIHVDNDDEVKSFRAVEDDVVDVPKVNTKPAFKFPDFDENEFERTRPRRSVEVRETREVRNNDYDDYRSRDIKRHVEPVDVKRTTEAPARRVFKPTPIISPVYGILDKNYDPDDLKKDRIVNTIPVSRSNGLSVDDVRKKAFGNLESLTKEEPVIESKTVMEIMDNIMEHEEVKEELPKETFKTVDLKETLSDISKNLENINDKMDVLEEKVDNKYEEHDDLDEPRSAIDLLNEIESELDEITNDIINDDEKNEIDNVDEFVSLDDELPDIDDEDTSESIVTDDSDSDELLNLIDAMYDANNDDGEDEE